PLEIEGTVFDVLKFDPAAARELLRRAGVNSLRIEILYPNRPATTDLPQILQQQWRSTFGAEVIPVVREENVWLQARRALAYKGLSERCIVGDYLDPNTFLEAFQSGSDVSGSGCFNVGVSGGVARLNTGVAQRANRVRDGNLPSSQRSINR